MYAACVNLGLTAAFLCLCPAPVLLQAKRSRGAPKASKPGDKVHVSIVVTDVKDFSDLTRQYPEAMNKAMGVHNNILRKASHNHAGYIMDQEVSGLGGAGCLSAAPEGLLLGGCLRGVN